MPVPPLRDLIRIRHGQLPDRQRSEEMAYRHPDLRKVNFAQVYPAWIWSSTAISALNTTSWSRRARMQAASAADRRRQAQHRHRRQLVLSAANGPAGFKSRCSIKWTATRSCGRRCVHSGRQPHRLQTGQLRSCKTLIIDPVLTYATYLGGSTNDYLGGAQSLGSKD